MFARAEGRTQEKSKKVERPLFQGVQSEAELSALRRSTARGTPFGSERWMQRVARRLGLESSDRRRGRPKKDLKEQNCAFSRAFKAKPSCQRCGGALPAALRLAASDGCSEWPGDWGLNVRSGRGADPRKI